MKRALALAITVALAGCLGEPGVRCADGTLCPDDTTCTLVEGSTRCATADELSECSGAADGTSCMISGQPVGLCRDQVCVRMGCGDGFVTGAEQCDGDAFGSGIRDCRDLGYYTAGTLACAADCTLDLAGCAGAGKCGDGVVNGDEACDGDALPNGSGCEDYVATPGTATMFHAGGDVACAVDCTLSFAACSGGFCGDAVKQDGEVCDGFDVGSASCAPYSGGVTCSADCSALDYACTGSCGDDIVNGDERCDVVMPPGIDCATYGFHAGTPTCTADCSTILIASCSGVCGDGIAQPGETCDGIDQGGLDCSSFGSRGALGCSPDCQRDLDPCQTGAWVRRSSTAFASVVSNAIWSEDGVASWFVGQGTVFEWDGSQLADVSAGSPGSPLPAGVTWFAVTGDSERVWIGGTQVFRFDRIAHTWTAESIAGTPTVRGLWTNGTRVYAATTNGVWSRGNADPTATWVLEAGAGVEIDSVDGRGDTIVGAGTEILRKEGSAAWQQLPNTSGSWRYVRVWSATTFWVASLSAVAVYVEDPTPRLIAGVLPSQLGAGPVIRGLFLAAGDDVYVGVNGSQAAALVRFTGTYQAGAPAFAQLSVGSLPPLAALGGSSGGDIWIGTRGAVFHHDGPGWQIPSDPASTALPIISYRAVTASFQTVWFGGVAQSGSAGLVAYASSSPVPVPLSTIGTDVDALWTPDGNVVWVALGTSLTAVTSNGSPAPAGTTLPSAATAAWGVGSDVYFAAEGGVMHYDGATWTFEAITATASSGPTAIGGTLTSDIWVVGNGIYHRNANGTYASMPLPTGIVKMTGVWSAGPHDTWATGAAQGGDAPTTQLYHYDGVGWTQYATPLITAAMTAMWGSGPFDIWAVGTLGTAIHYDGLRWTAITTGTFEDLTAISGTSAHDVWAVGENGARIRLTAPLPSVSAGECAAAVTLYCGATMPVVGTVYGDAPAVYRLDLPAQGTSYPTTIAATLATGGDSANLDVTLHPAVDTGCDLSTSLAQPLAGSGGTTYYIEIARATGVVADPNSYTLSLACDYAPVP